MTVWLFDNIDRNSDGYVDKVEMKYNLAVQSLPDTDPDVNVSMFIDCSMQFKNL